MTAIRRISDLETLFSLLIQSIGSPTSITTLAKYLNVSYNTVQSWLSLFDRLYLTLTLTPWHRRITRAIHKERKTYIWDVPRIMYYCL